MFINLNQIPFGNTYWNILGIFKETLERVLEDKPSNYVILKASVGKKVNLLLNTDRFFRVKVFEPDFPCIVIEIKQLDFNQKHFNSNILTLTFINFKYVVTDFELHINFDNQDLYTFRHYTNLHMYKFLYHEVIPFINKRLIYQPKPIYESKTFRPYPNIKFVNHSYKHEENLERYNRL